MQFQRSKLLFKAVAIALLLKLAPSGLAATVTAPAAGDIFLGFRASGGQGAGTSYLVNVGNDSTFRNASPGSTINLGSLGDLGADLVATYGPTWYSRTDLNWGFFGSVNSASPAVYGSKAQSPLGTAAVDYPALSLAARSSTNVQIISVIDSYKGLTATANSAKAGLQSNTSTSASYNYQVATAGTTDFGSLSQWTTIEGSFGAGSAGTALDLFRLYGNSVDGNLVERLGTFTIDDSGVLTFTAAPLVNKVRVASISASAQENAGTLTLGFKRSGDLANAITATYSLTDVTAVGGTDYTIPGSLTVSFNATEATASANIAILNRAGYFGTRTFTATLVSATGGFIKSEPSVTSIAIADIEPDPGALSFSAASFAATTLDNTVAVTLQRTAGTAGAIAVNVSATGGTLVNGAGYTFTNPTTANFAHGATTATVNIPLSTLVPGTITLSLSSPTNFSRLGTQTTATVNVAGAPGALAFAASSYQFEESAGTVNIPIVRTGGVAGAISVKVNSANGSAQSGSDFTAIADYTANLADGATSVNVPVAIIESALAEVNESFTLTLSAPTGGATLGTTSSTTIRIVELDILAPTISLTAPAANAKLTATPVAVTGSATDDKGLESVLVQLNGGAPVSATLTPNTDNTRATFTASVSPVPGLNTLTVFSVDAAGNESAPVNRTFTYVVTSPITVSIDGASPANSGAITAPFALTGASIEEGRSYTITAKANAGFIFGGWSGTGITGTPAAELPALTFTHRTGLTITALFKANPFTAAIIGDYNGLVTAVNPALASQSTQGFINVKPTVTGAFTGTLRIEGLTVALKGNFNSLGQARFDKTLTATAIIPRGVKPSYVLALNLDLNPLGTNKITGTLGEQFRSTVTPLSNVNADRAYYSAGTVVPTINQGTFTVVLPSQTQTNGLVAADYPQGDGVGTITITAAGLVTFKGTLADGTPVTAAAPLSKDKKAPLFAQLYATRGGSWGGQITVDETQTDSDLSGSSFLWFRPYIPGQHYPFGWLEGVTTALRGAKYSVPVGSSVVPLLPAVSNTLGNAVLAFSDGKLNTTISKKVNITRANVVTKVPFTDASYTLTLTAATGDVKGTFTHSDGTKPAFQGVIYQKGNQGGAYGFFLSSKPKVVDGKGESGGISLTRR